MENKREEMLAWAKSLKPGDKVIKVRSLYSGPREELEVDHVTPKGWVKTTDGKTFSQVSWGSGFLYIRGGNSYIIPAAKVILEEAQQQSEAKISGGE